MAIVSVQTGDKVLYVNSENVTHIEKWEHSTYVYVTGGEKIYLEPKEAEALIPKLQAASPLKYS